MTEQQNPHRYCVTIGDYDGNANVRQTDDLARAEEYADRMLGREWGDFRTICLARIFEWTGTEYTLLTETEF